MEGATTVTQEPERVIEDGEAWVTFAYYEELLAERDALVARVKEAEAARAEAERNERHTRNLHDWRAKGEQEQRERADALAARLAEAEARVAALTEALDGAKETIRRMMMRYQHPLTEHQVICECVACKGIRSIDSALAAADRPEGTTPGATCCCPAGSYNPGNVHEDYCDLSGTPRFAAWLIERNVPGRAKPPFEWVAREWPKGPTPWTTDAWAARRFPTQQVAETHMRKHGVLYGVAVEHAFVREGTTP